MKMRGIPTLDEVNELIDEVNAAIPVENVTRIVPKKNSKLDV